MFFIGMFVFVVAFVSCTTMMADLMLDMVNDSTKGDWFLAEVEYVLTVPEDMVFFTEAEDMEFSPVVEDEADWDMVSGSRWTGVVLWTAQAVEVEFEVDSLDFSEEPELDDVIPFFIQYQTPFRATFLADCDWQDEMGWYRI